MTAEISPSQSFSHLDDYHCVDYHYATSFANKDERPLNAKDRLSELIQMVEDEAIAAKMKVELKRLMADHDRLVTMLQQRSEILENEIGGLKTHLSDNQRRYEKAVREMQFFKKKYEKLSVEANKPNIQTYELDSNARFRDNARASSVSSVSQPPPFKPSFSSASSVASSSAAAPTTCAPSSSSMVSTSSLDVDAYTYHESAELARPISMAGHGPSSTYWHSTPSSMSSISEGAPVRSRKNSIAASVYSTISSLTDHTASTRLSDKTTSTHRPKSIWQFSRNPSTSSSYSSQATSIASCSASMYSVPVTPTRSSATTNGYNCSSLIQQRRVDPLIFGASDGLWDTISKSFGSDAASEKIIANFLRRGGSPNTARQSPTSGPVKYGYGLLHAMIVTKAAVSLDLLLQQGANPNALTKSETEEDKVTPIYLAASVGWLEGLERLVLAGADIVNARGEGLKQKTALHVAAEHCHATTVEYLVAATQGALSLELDNQGATALHYACGSGHTDMVSFLVRSCQVPVNQADRHDELPLHWAVRQGRLEVVTLLIEQFGCDCNTYVSRKMGTPLDLAKARGHKRLVEYLKGLGALTAKKLEKRRPDLLIKEKSSHGLEAVLLNNGF